MVLTISPGVRRGANAHSLLGWLHFVGRRTAIGLVRKELRPQMRETEAVYPSSMKSNEPDWSEVESLLDDALSSLRDVDRQALGATHVDHGIFFIRFST